jgi:hypothetical protein
LEKMPLPAYTKPSVKMLWAFSLGYYYGDYTPIGGGGAFSAYQSNTGDDSGKALFNGNITNSTYDLAKINGGAVGVYLCLRPIEPD